MWMFSCSETCDKMVFCVPILLSSTCSGGDCPKGCIIHLQSPSRSEPEQAGLSWVEATFPRQEYLKDVPRHIMPASATPGNPLDVPYNTTFLFRWWATTFLA